MTSHRVVVGPVQLLSRSSTRRAPPPAAPPSKASYQSRYPIASAMARRVERGWLYCAAVWANGRCRPGSCTAPAPSPAPSARGASWRNAACFSMDWNVNGEFSGYTSSIRRDLLEPPAARSTSRGQPVDDLSSWSGVAGAKWFDGDAFGLDRSAVAAAIRDRPLAHQLLERHRPIVLGAQQQPDQVALCRAGDSATTSTLMIRLPKGAGGRRPCVARTASESCGCRVPPAQSFECLLDPNRSAVPSSTQGQGRMSSKAPGAHRQPE